MSDCPFDIYLDDYSKITDLGWRLEGREMGDGPIPGLYWVELSTEKVVFMPFERDLVQDMKFELASWMLMTAVQLDYEPL